ncbi:uncharacterized protein LOC128223865 [Mya arenaria]|uniref:uncharacterized protein LOC128223865 n=1 Tax=Mya arenaria TaxID=6604 RepID=UPI0022E59921|nr:uncharacterized protein LOC128223865 [Mya arenaria]
MCYTCYIFQNGDAMAGHLHEEMRVIRTVMSKFVKMHVIKSAADVTKVDYATRHNQHDDDNIGVGQDARNYMKSDDVTSQTKANFFSKVRAFYMEMTEKMLSKFPVNNPILKSLGFLRPELRDSTPAKSVCDLAVRLGSRDG